MSDVSAETLARLAELVKAATSSNASIATNSSFPAYLKGWTEFANAVAWPLATILCVFLFRRPLTKFLGDVDTVKFLGAEISRKISNQLDQSAREAQTKSEAELRLGPTAAELRRAQAVSELAEKASSGVVVAQAELLAADYERVRASMLPGNDRTRAMEVVVSKMRTIGQAFFPFRHEFAGSASPGKRLMVIASLQVFRDFERLDWLAQRVGSEKPFLQYQSLVAILLATRGENAKSYIANLQATVDTIRQFKDRFGSDTSRTGTLEEIERALNLLKEAR